MDLERLTYMANQIARNLAPQGAEAAAEMTAQHIRDYWDPRMKVAILGADRSGLEPIAAGSAFKSTRASAGTVTSQNAPA